ncbi:MAG: ATP-dependent DNA ligase [Terriglobales bacterium]
MLRFAQTAESIAATNSKLVKTALVADYLRSLPVPEAAMAAIFLSGGPFPSCVEATLQVGGALLWRVIADLSGKTEPELSKIYRSRGDAGSVAADALPAKVESVISLQDVQRAFKEIAAARGPAAKAALLSQLLSPATPLEAKYIVKIIGGDLRIGLKESLVEEAIAKAFETPLDQVKRANMLLGDIGETLRLASEQKLGEARLRLFHPIDFMLASPVESAQEAVSYFHNAAVEDKYDGIRAQAHIGCGQARLFSRTRDEITESFPELPPALAGIPEDAILDGEIVAWNAANDDKDIADVHGRALPFSTLQQRLGRKKVSERLIREVPAAYLVFDVLYANGQLLLDKPLRERRQRLDELLARPRSASAQLSRGQSAFAFGESEDAPKAHVLAAPVAVARTAEDLEQLFTAARNRGNEGLMIKDLDSLYTPGRRGKSWLKMKRELATLDVVVTAVEYGHGKRIGVLSDYTFAVWNGDRLVNIGKAYSGLTDAEIAEMTKWFLAHKISEQGLRLEVEPKIVLEVAFNNMMQSARHESGYALRFPRIVRLRPDKPPEDADTIETVKEIFERQHAG